MPRGKPGSGEHADKGMQTKRVSGRDSSDGKERNAHHDRYSRGNKAGTDKFLKRGKR